MSNELIGFENLPNAFIKEINITNINSKQDLYEVTIRVHDLPDRSVWSATQQDFFKLMRVALLFSTDLTESNSISNGKLDLSTLSYETKSIMIEPKLIENNTYFELKFKKIFAIGLPNITAFAFCMISREDILSSMGIDLQRNYMGPIKSEKIIQSNNVVSNTNVFIRTDGSYWPGPVHEHNGRFMEGSYHTSAPHNELTRLSVVNTKIKDNRETIQTSNSQQTTINNTTSKLYVSYSSETDINSIFMINMKSMLMKHTKYGKFLSNTNESVVSTLIKKMTFRMISIQRQRIKSNYRSTSMRSKKIKADKIFSRKNILNTQDDVNRNVLKKTRFERNGAFDLLPGEVEDTSDYKKIADIEELYFDYGKEIRTFQFTDYEMNFKTPGDYRYKIEFQFVDPTDKFLKEALSVMKTDLSSLSDYLGLFSQNRIVSLNFNQLVKNYLDHYSYIYELRKASRINLSLKYINHINPATANKSSIFKFLKAYRDLYNNFLVFMDYDDKKIKNNRLSVKSKENMSSRIIVEKVFDEIITPSKNTLSFSYLPENTRKTAVYTKSAFLQKAEEEVEEEFVDQPNFSFDQTSSIVGGGFSDVQSTKTAFFGPKEFLNGPKKERMSNTRKGSSFLNSSIRDNRRPSGKMDVAVSVQPTPKPKQEVEEGGYLESSKILGSGHEFTGYTEQNDDFNKPSIRTKAQTKFNDSLTQFGSNRTFTATLEATRNISPDEARNLPNQLKAVINGQDSATRSNFIINGNDLLANPSTKNFFELKNFSVKEVVYVDSFEKDARGNLLLNKPVFKTLMLKDFEQLNSPALCFLKDYSNERFNISGAETIQAVNSVFVIADKDISSPRDEEETTTDPIYGTEETEYQFMNSNIVRQTNNVIISQSLSVQETEDISSPQSSNLRSSDRPTFGGTTSSTRSY